jgi:hypothetical protein
MWNRDAAVVHSDDTDVWRAVRTFEVLIEFPAGKVCRGYAVPPLFGVSQSCGQFVKSGVRRSRIMETWRRQAWQIVESTCAAVGNWSTSRSATTASKA